MKKRFSNFTSIVALFLSVTICFCTFGSVTAVTGDFDRSSDLTAKDAIYLLYNTIYGDEEYPLYYDGDMNQDGVVDSDDAVYLLYSVVFGEGSYPLPEEMKLLSNVTLHNNGINSYDMVIGSDLPKPGAYIDQKLIRHEFLGWYDSTLTTKYTTVPENDIQLYALYEDCELYSFDSGVVYDPNNRNLMVGVNNPFGESGKVLYTQVLNQNDKVYYGFYRGLVPSVHDGVGGLGFDFKKGHTYEVTFSYRYAEGTEDSASTSVSVYAVDPQGVHKDGYKSQVSASAINSSSMKLANKGDWNTCSFRVKNTTDYKHMYIRMIGGSKTTVYDLYIDNLIIIDTTVDTETVVLFNNGTKEKTDLTVGDTLPTLEPYYDDVLDKDCQFIGWFDESFTTQYTTVVEGVTNYYAKFEYITKLTFEYSGMYDPNKKYSATSGGIPAWYREVDKTNNDNIVLRAKLHKNSNNTHVALSNAEGSSLGYKLTEGMKYVISFDYYIDSTQINSLEIAFRGAAGDYIGKSGEKTDGLSGAALVKANAWNKSYGLFTAEGTTDKPYFIMLAQGNEKYENVKIYIDNIVIRELPGNYDIVIKTPAENLTFNDNGSISKIEQSNIGDDLPELKNYYGATSIGWYNDLLNVQYLTVPAGDFEFFAKYDGAVFNFENGGIYDPNGNLGVDLMNFNYSTDPANGSNTVIKADLTGGNNNHFALNASGYSTDGYKLKVGNTYTISFMYYAENNGNSVNVQFRGADKDSIGINGGKSNGFGGMILSKEKEWTGVTTTFTYTGEGLSADEHYLLMLAQDGDMNNATATIYFDDIVIKETEPTKSYSRKSVKIGGWTLGYYKFSIFNPIRQSIVVPSANFSYLARMQCDEMLNVVKNIGENKNCSTSIVKDSSWSQSNYKFSIFVGKVNVNPSDSQYKIDTTNFTDDDYAFCVGVNSIYVDGGSTYALAMGVSEVTKYLESLPNGSSVETGTYVSGKYSEKINSYSTKNYYRPTFLEDFDQEDVDTSIWNEIDGSDINARDFIDANGNRVSASTTVDDQGNTIKGHGWKSVRSDAHTYLEDGKLIIDGAYSEEDKTFYGGMLRSHGKMEYRYGYLEVSCITPNGEGLWTAMWATQGSGSTGLLGSEIDINESFGNARYSAFNMHSWPTASGKNAGITHYSLDGRYSTAKKADAGEGKTFNDGFHTFGYLWTPEGAKFIVDGQVYFEYNYDKNSTKYYKNDVDAFNEKLSLIISMTVANPSSGADPILGAEYWQKSNKYIVDYIHIYQIDGQEIYFYGDETEAE